MRLSTHSAVPVYTISGSSTGRALPDWLSRKRKKSLKNDAEFASRIEILQDFEFEEASQCIQVSEDGEWVMSTGTYKPQIHTHYLPHLALSYARHTISLNKTFVLLSSDYSKSLHLQADRSVEFHTSHGCHYTVRVPRYGRDLKYNRLSAEALVPTAGINENGLGEVFRINLEVGKFMKAYEVDVGGDADAVGSGSALQGSVNAGSVNVAAVAERSHGLLAFGTSIGTVEFMDPRSRRRVGLLQDPSKTDFIHGHQEITALEFDDTGLGIGTGSSGGLIHLYDLRSPAPILQKDQGYGFPVQDIIYLSSAASRYTNLGGRKILSSDKRIIKLWSADDGSPWTSVEPTVDINKVAWCKDSGMLLTANEGRQQHAFFIPQLGPAPRWCSFLDNLVEEMAEDQDDPQAYKGQKAGETYDNYKFLTPEQLETLNLSHLVGTTTLLRPYMHGYFVAQRLYEEAKMIADPFIWEERRNKRLKEKIDAERESRIRGSKQATTKVNRRLAQKLMDRKEREEMWQAKKVLQNGGDEPAPTADTIPPAANGDVNSDGEEKPSDNLLSDPRFAKLFQDEDYAIDETSQEFQQLNPGSRRAVDDSDDRKPRGLTAVEKEAMEDVPASDDSSADNDTDGSEDEEDAPERNRKEQIRPASKGQAKPNSKAQGVTKTSLSMREYSSTSDPRSRRNTARDLPFGARTITARQPKPVVANVGGEKEITFEPSKKTKSSPAQNAIGREEAGKANGTGRSHNDRRSASGNVMRRM